MKINLKVYQNVKTLKWYYSIIVDDESLICSDIVFPSMEIAKRAAIARVNRDLAPCATMCEADDGVTTCATCKWDTYVSNLKEEFLKEGVFDV